MNPVKFFLVDRDPKVVEALETAFGKDKNICILRSDICKTSGPKMVIATAANSFGEMNGGVDGAINTWLSSPYEYLSDRVKRVLREKYHGEQPVGTCFFVPPVNPVVKWVAHVPTMRVPKDVSKTFNAYHAFRALVSACLNMTDINAVTCPAFCTGAGEMSPETAARQMKLAWDSVTMFSETSRDWKEIWDTDRALQATIQSK